MRLNEVERNGTQLLGVLLDNRKKPNDRLQREVALRGLPNLKVRLMGTHFSE